MPLSLSSVQAGFPSVADDSIEKALDLNEFLIENPDATFFVRVEGDSMVNAGIHSGDILCVDRSLEARDGDIVIVVIDGEATVKRLRIHSSTFTLHAENEEYAPLTISTESDAVIWGVVRACIKKFK